MEKHGQAEMKSLPPGAHGLRVQTDPAPRSIPQRVGRDKCQEEPSSNRRGSQPCPSLVRRHGTCRAWGGWEMYFRWQDQCEQWKARVGGDIVLSVRCMGGAPGFSLAIHQGIP